MRFLIPFAPQPSSSISKERNDLFQCRNNVNFNKLICLIKNYVKYGSTIVNTQNTTRENVRDFPEKRKKEKHRKKVVIILLKATVKGEEEKWNHAVILSLDFNY